MAGKVLVVKVYASPFLGGWAHPALPEQSLEQLARFLQVIALNTPTFLDHFLQVLPFLLLRFAQRKTWRLELAQDKFESFLCFFVFADKPFFKRAPTARKANT